MKLQLENSIGQVFELSQLYPTAKLSGFSLGLEFSNIEKSFTPGSFIVGEKRLSSSEIVATLNIIKDTDVDFMKAFNELCSFAVDCEYINDTENLKRTQVSAISIEKEEVEGSELRDSIITITFSQLTPFWEYTEYDVNSFADLSNVGVVMNVTNAGFLPTPPILEITTTAACNSLSIISPKSGEGITVDSNIFGAGGDATKTMIIDNSKGTIFVGDTDISSDIVVGSGFFDFPVGLFELTGYSTIPCTLKTTFRKRYYI